MASRNTTDEKKQKSRIEVAELNWDQCKWPQCDRYRDLYWAALNGVSVRTFRELVYESGIPYRRVGQNIWVDASDMEDGLPKLSGTPPTKARRPTLQRKKRTTDGQAKGSQTRKR